MPGFDSRGGQPLNYTLGRGKLYLADDSSKTTGLGTGTAANSQRVWRDVGNVTAFTVTQESETKEHKSSLQGLQVIDLEVAVSQKMTLAFTVDELNANNIARFLSGQYVGLDNDTGTSGLVNGAAVASANASVITTAADRNFFVDTDATDRVHDVWYDLTLTLLGVTNAPCVDFEAQATQAITVSKNATDNLGAGTPTTLVAGTHYEIDRKMGRIRFIDAGAGGLVAGNTFLVSWAAPTTAKSATPGLDDSLWVVKPLTTSGISVGLKFILENANDGDHQTAYEFWQVKVKPDGELAGIGDDWATLNFTGVVESVAAPGRPYGSEFGRVIGRNSYST